MTLSQLCAVVFISGWAILLLFVGAVIAAFLKNWPLAGGLFLASLVVAVGYGIFMKVVNE